MDSTGFVEYGINVVDVTGISEVGFGGSISYGYNFLFPTSDYIDWLTKMDGKFAFLTHEQLCKLKKFHRQYTKKTARRDRGGRLVITVSQLKLSSQNRVGRMKEYDMQSLFITDLKGEIEKAQKYSLIRISMTNNKANIIIKPTYIFPMKNFFIYPVFKISFIDNSITTKTSLSPMALLSWLLVIGTIPTNFNDLEYYPPFIIFWFVVFMPQYFFRRSVINKVRRHIKNIS